MKKLITLSVFALCAGMMFSSCNKDEDSNEPGFSSNTVEENKAVIEQSGKDLIDELSSLQDGKAYNALIQLKTLFGGEKVCLLSDIEAISNGSLKSFSVPDLTAYVADFQGVYTWDSTTEEFSFQEAEGYIEYLFPYTGESTSNDCHLKVTTSFTGDQTLPSSVEGSLTINDVKVLTLKLQGSYSSMNYPTLLSTSLTIDDITSEISLTRTDSKLSASSSVLKGSSVLLNATFSLVGDMSDTQIEKMNNDTLSEDGSNVLFELVNSEEISFTVMDVKLVSAFDVSKLEEAEQQIIELGQEATTEKVEEIMKPVNDNLTAYVMQVSKNAKIADVKFFFEEVEEGYGAAVTPKLVFADGTSTYPEVYFSEGFEDIKEQIQDLMGTEDEEEY